jgi:hypothetical protein
MLCGGPYTITDNIVMALDASPTFTFIKYEDRSSDGTPPEPYVVAEMEGQFERQVVTGSAGKVQLPPFAMVQQRVRPSGSDH